jgi:serine/threonine-protein kinase
LGGLGLSTGVSYKPGIKPLGVVVSQQPAAGTEVKKGSQVDMVVRSSTELPDLRAMTAEEAQEQLKALGFTKVATVSLTSTEAAGTVLAQAPQPGAALALDDQITLTIASQGISVPPVVGHEFHNAVRLLENAGLSVRQSHVCPSFILCTVVAQNPPALRVVPPGTNVVLILRRVG